MCVVTCSRRKSPRYTPSWRPCSRRRTPRSDSGHSWPWPSLDPKRPTPKSCRWGSKHADFRGADSSVVRVADFECVRQVLEQLVLGASEAAERRLATLALGSMGPKAAEYGAVKPLVSAYTPTSTVEEERLLNAARKVDRVYACRSVP